MDILEAVTLAARLHGGQVDKAGEPYIGHCFRVMLRLPGDAAPSTRIAALLHDTIEDCGVDGEALALFGVPPASIRLIECLTHRDGEPYVQYISRIADYGAPAIQVKRADIEDNLDRTRLGALPPDMRKRLLLKYTTALRQMSVHGGARRPKT